MTVQRIASVIGIPAENVAEYERLHAEVWPQVLDRLSRSNMHNYSIYRYGTLLFSYLEYTGEDLEADRAAIAADPTTQEWWTHTDPLQVPVTDRSEGEWWKELPEVFHLD